MNDEIISELRRLRKELFKIANTKPPEPMCDRTIDDVVKDMRWRACDAIGQERGILLNWIAEKKFK